MTYEILDDRKWRVSRCGFSIKTGWSDEKKIIAKYPGSIAPVSPEQFTEWLENAERICDLYNATLALRGEIDASRAKGEFINEGLDEHPDGYEGPCWCGTCRSYMAQDCTTEATP